MIPNNHQLFQKESLRAARFPFCCPEFVLNSNRITALLLELHQDQGLAGRNTHCKHFLGEKSPSIVPPKSFSSETGLASWAVFAYITLMRSRLFSSWLVSSHRDRGFTCPFWLLLRGALTADNGTCVL